MNTASTSRAIRLLRSLCVASLLGALAACGGGDDPVTPPSADQPPTLTLTSPAPGTTYRAGERITVSAAATDREDGTLPAGRLSWWIDLHHDTHSHPAQPLTAGTGGDFEVPVRMEVSPNVWYRVHVRATDSTGHTVEVTRDVQPRTAEVTLATEPAGLTLTLDGQPVIGPHSFTGVPGVERDLGAATQVFGGRRYAFSSWSDGGAAVHTLSTPTVNTTYTATFHDIGAADNTPPAVSLTATANGVVGTPLTLTAIASDADGTVARVQFYDGSTLLGEAMSSPYQWSWTPATAGVHTLTARATDNDGDATTSTAVTVNVLPATVSDVLPPVVALTSPSNLAAVSGTLTVTATATDNVGVTAVEFQVDGAALGSEDTTAPYEATWNTRDHPAGQHIVRARARDAAGNVSAWASATVQIAGDNDVPRGFEKDDRWIRGLDNATAFVQAPDGRFFIAEQDGRLRIATANGRLQAPPFLTLPVDSNGERGLIGVTLHPSFPSSAWVYVHYTSGQGRPHNRISRFLALGDMAIGLEDTLVDLPDLSSATNHNGGAIHFGADGKLYVGVGDNANSAHSPDLNVPFGKLLRFNADGSIPSDNPHYATQSGLARAIWASGLRNPFTFAIEPSTGRIHINDVGEATWEEINLGTAGANYGWPSTEGPTSAAGIATPLFAYGHDPASPAGSGPGGFFNGQSLTGGTFYPATGGSFPSQYRRSYFFADYVSKFVGRLDAANGYAAYAFATMNDNPVDMLVGLDGALYVLTRKGVTRIAPSP